MSHNTSSLVPWIASFTDSFSAAGASTLTLTGFGLSLATDVDLSTLGVETGRAYTATDGDGNGNLVISLTVATLPSTPAMVQVKVSTGGVPAVQSPLSVRHGWDPSLLTPALWWDADDGTTFGYSSGEIITWTDKSSTGVIAEQADASRRAVRAVRSEFSGGTASGHVFVAEASKHVDFPGALPTIVDGSNQFTHFVVLSLHDQETQLIRLGVGSSPVWKLDGNDGPAIHHGTTAGNTGGERTAVPTANYLGDGVAHLVTIIGDASAGYSTRLNGSEVSAPDGDTLQAVQPSASSTASSYLGYIGNAYFAEIIHVPRLCSASEIDTVEDYLNTKWSIWT